MASNLKAFSFSFASGSSSSQHLLSVLWRRQSERSDKLESIFTVSEIVQTVSFQNF